VRARQPRHHQQRAQLRLQPSVALQPPLHRPAGCARHASSAVARRACSQHHSPPARHLLSQSDGGTSGFLLAVTLSAL
jgi:hypothetical protein